MTFRDNLVPRHGGRRAAIDRAYRADEARTLASLMAQASLPEAAAAQVAERAAKLVAGARALRASFGGIEAFLQEYGLTTPEGVAMMCLAEALLRVPDSETADRLIEDKIGGADWQRHVGAADSLFVNASTWALMLTGRVLSAEKEVLGRVVRRLGEPVIREALRQAMRILGRQFVMGRTIAEALERAVAQEKRGYRYSYDMLGEAARTAADAERYHRSYRDAIAAIGKAAAGRGPITAPGISIKLSALHPRFEPAQRDRAVPALVASLAALARDAKRLGIGLTVDAEEADRLDPSLDVIEAVAGNSALAGWGGLGLAVQAYQKRALPVLDWLDELAERTQRRLMVRLVKGAYWDTEIKRAQERGLDGYPVFTRKVATDVSYLAGVRRLLASPARFYPQFATHNAHTVAYAEAAAEGRDFEFQRLHGMGEPLYDQVVGADRPVRVYAPVGSHEDLLAYLVRRLLENGANTSFVNRLQDEDVAPELITADPVAKLAASGLKPHPRIPLPANLYGSERRNSRGLDLTDPAVLGPLIESLDRADPKPAGHGRPVTSPADRRRVLGHVVEATEADADRAMAAAHAAWRGWDDRGAAERAAILDRAAELYEGDGPALMALLVREGGKTIPDALAELREAADYCRYYAMLARRQMARPMALPGPTGEDNSLALQGRGVFACISPWNFPLAIFTGQVAAALAAGNAVIAKPAEQTPLVAARAVALLHQAGVPADVLHLLTGKGSKIGPRLTADERIAGVAVTGSTETAQAINRALAARTGAIVPLIAETGGQNALIADSTALPEQVVADVLDSAFRSAGQRCSALRVLFVQDDIADRVLTMLKGAAEALVIGDPALLATDVGPVIDDKARDGLAAHAERMTREGKLLFQLPLGAETAHGSFFAPRAFEIDRLSRLTREVFGPILHVIRYDGERLDDVLDQITATGYGLTLGIHSRIEATQRAIHRRLAVGNTYVNRNMIGAVVGVQPFGGHGLSGTGPKAGGPHYLLRFAAERTLSVNTTAAGGNATLVSLAEE